MHNAAAEPLQSLESILSYKKITEKSVYNDLGELRTQIKVDVFKMCLSAMSLPILFY